MTGVRPCAGLRQVWTIHLSTVAVLLLVAVVGCGSEHRSAAVSGDTLAAPGLDSTSARTPDTASAAVVDSPAARPRDTTPAAPVPSVAQKTPPKKPAAKPTAPKPAAPAAPAQPAETSSTSSASPESTGVAPVQTSDASAPLRDAYHTAPLDTVPQEVYNGWKQFNLNCARCHGEDVQGTTIAPHLIVSLRPDGPINTKELFVQTVCAGRPTKGMPSWCSLGLGMDMINEIYSYVKGRSDSKIHPGRPAVKAGG
jgi:hypothetical protein